MLIYILKRLLLIVPTLLGILLLNFVIVQAAPGGPVEKAIAQLQGIGGGGAGGGFAGTTQDLVNSGGGDYRGSRGMPPELLERIEKLYGFDKPAPERFWLMIKRYLTFDFGESYYRDKDVSTLIAERLPVSISLGLWSTLITYLVAVPLGIKKAVRDGSRFDVWSSTAIIVGYAIPSFLIAILLVVLFAGGSYWEWFPLRGLTSDNFDQLPWWRQALDYLHHITLPTLAIVIGNFATLTMLTKNSFLDEISKQYVQTARAKGLPEWRVVTQHALRGGLIPVIAFLGPAFAGLLAGSFVVAKVAPGSHGGVSFSGFPLLVRRGPR